jgi:hypothetical protein
MGAIHILALFVRLEEVGVEEVVVSLGLVEVVEEFIMALLLIVLLLNWGKGTLVVIPDTTAGQ